MADINQVITLGVGIPSDIEHFILLGLNGVEETAAEFTLPLHAGATGMLLHAEAPWGTRNTIYTLATLTDENAAVLIDETGAILTAFGATGAIVLHARETNTLLHAESI